MLIEAGMPYCNFQSCNRKERSLPSSGGGDLVYSHKDNVQGDLDSYMHVGVKWSLTRALMCAYSLYVFAFVC